MEFITPLIIPIIFIVGIYMLMKLLMSTSYNQMVRMAKTDPQKFKERYIEEGQMNADTIIRELERIEKVKKVKIMKPSPPMSASKILATTIDGAEYWYKLTFKQGQPPYPMKLISIEKMIGEL